MTVDGFSILLYTVFGICVLRGLCRGFIKTVISLCGVILTLVLVWALAPKMESFLQGKTPLYEKIEESSQEYLIEAMGKQDGLELKEQESVIAGLPLPRIVREGIAANNNAEIYSDMLVHTFAEYLAQSIAGFGMRIAAYLLTFLVSGIVVKVLSWMLEQVFQIPGLRTFNTIGGGMLGCLLGLVFIWLIFLAVTLFYGTEWGRSSYEVIQGNEAFRFLYDRNLFLYLIGLL